MSSNLQPRIAGIVVGLAWPVSQMRLSWIAICRWSRHRPVSLASLN